MRNYGAAIADAVVLVVDVSQGVCLQTEECIGIIEGANVPALVAINKIDLIPEEK